MQKLNTPMQIALQLAQIALEQDEVPIGAVITHNGEIIATSHNMTKQLNDNLAHAELLALKKAMQKLGSDRLIDCDIYVTLEPCIMCAGAIALTKIKRLYYAASSEKTGAICSGIFNKTQLQHQIEIYPSIGEKAAAELLKIFFQRKRLT